MKTIAIVPVKRFAYAKERLTSVLDPEQRAQLAEAMFLDTLSHLRRSKRIEETIVVTAEPVVVRTARWLGIDVIEQETDGSHSLAAAAGVERALSRGADRVAILPADCPLLDAAELDRHLGIMPRTAVIVPDRHGTGTNGLLLCPPDTFTPAFGPGSCARHAGLARAAGIAYAIERISSLALDIDTHSDLIELRETLVLEPSQSPRTAELVWQFENGSTPGTPAVA
ncbi:MAG: 2-phospho-L-lactate guanylyltransferase [Solirubrobacterales bacterium]